MDLDDEKGKTMKTTFDLDRKYAAKILRSLAGQIQRKSWNPILDSVVLAVGEDKIEVIATDLQSVTTMKIGYNVSNASPTSFLVPFGEFKNFVCNSKTDLITIEHEDGKVTLISNGNRIECLSEEVEKFPAPIPKRHDDVVQLTLDLGKFRQGLERTVIAAANESSRYALDCVLFEFENFQLTVVGTDGKRMAASRLGQYSGFPPTEFADEVKTTIIPVKTCLLILKLIKSLGKRHHNTVTIAANAETLSVTCSEFTVICRYATGRYPRWRDVKPFSSFEADLDCSSLLVAFRDGVNYLDDEHRGMDVHLEAGRMILSVDYEGRSWNAALETNYYGEPIDATLDPCLIIDWLKMLDPKDGPVKLVAGSDRKAFLFRHGPNPTYPEVEFLVIPLTRERDCVREEASV